jgi:hypothetical protein
MGIVIGIVVGIVVALAVALAYVRATEWLREARRARYAFENREKYLLIKLDGPLGAGEDALVTMKALREAMLLKVAGMSSGRALVDASRLRLANARAFWILIGGIGPLLLNPSVNVAVVSGRRSRTARQFQSSGILNCLPSVREGERHLLSGQPRPPMPFDAEYVNDLLAPGRRKAA